MTPRPARPFADAPRRWPQRLAGLCLAGAAGLAFAQAPAAPADAASAPPERSALDAPMFYQVMVAEMEAQAGRLGNAYDIMLDAARRLKSSQLFQRAVELGVQMRAGDKALAAAAAWRQAQPDSLDALRAQVELLVATNQPADLAEPLRSLLQHMPENQRAAMIYGVPRFLEPIADKPRALALAEQVLGPYAGTAAASPAAVAVRTAARTSLGQLALAAGQPGQALSLARQALADDPAATPPIVLALELMPSQPDAEALVQSGLARPEASPAARMVYARWLEQRQRVVEAIAQMKLALQQQPDLPQGWLSLGAAQLDLRESADAQASLQRALQQLPAQAAEPPDQAGDEESDEPVSEGERAHKLQLLIWQLMAQAAEQRGDDAGVQAALAHVPPEQADLSMLVLQASVLQRQGKLDAARKLVREGPAADQPDARARLLAEVQLLRNAGQWQTAYDLLLGALRQSPDDAGVIYELAMTAEHLKRYDDMEALLRRAIQLKADDAQAYNALGYSLAERRLRLDEAAQLIAKAVLLAPDDPFIADSQGWVDYQRGDRDAALRVLRRAYASRPHPEVAAHLGEVLWTGGQRDEARRVFRDGLAREPGNEVLRETMARLKVQP